MKKNNRIIIAGGYGVIGRRVAAHLASEFPGRVVLAGRNLPEAEKAANAIGYGTTARHLDVSNEQSVAAAIRDAELVMACVGQPERLLFKAAAENGLAYTDTAPYLVRWQNADTFEKAAKKSGARIILGTGLAPGISSMMAAEAAHAVGPLREIESTVLLGAHNATGADAMNFFFDESTHPFTLWRGGRGETVRPFSEPAAVDFPAPLGKRRAYLFPFSDVVLYPRTLGVETAISRLALDPQWTGRVLAGLIALGAGPRILRAARTISHLRKGNANTFGLVVTARGKKGEVTLRLAGRDQAAITALSAAEFCRLMLKGRVKKTGIWCAEEIIPHREFFARLSDAGYHIEKKLC